MNHRQSSSCEAAGEQAQVGEEEPSGGTGDGCLEVFGEATAAAEASKGALDDPSPGQKLEAFDAWRALDDLDGPGAAIGDGVAQLFAAIDAVGEDVMQPGEGTA